MVYVGIQVVDRLERYKFVVGSRNNTYISRGAFVCNLFRAASSLLTVNASGILPPASHVS